MKLGYNTNGLVHHRWDQALELMAEIGYRSVAITVDHQWLNPFSQSLAYETSRVRKKLEQLEMSSVIETGARYLLNPRKKHEPTLVSPTAAERDTRISFLCQCVDLADALGADAVSFWSGAVRDQTSWKEAMYRLSTGLRRVMLYAERKHMPLAFEPEPGMLIESMDDYSELLDHCDGPQFGLTIDIGHVHCVETVPIPDVLTKWQDRLKNIHIEDMLHGIHEHLPFGEGTIDFPPVMHTLQMLGYTGGVHVELSRHSHEAPERLQSSYDFLSACLEPKPE